MANGNGNPRSQEVTDIDGSLDFSGGVNSYLVPTIASERNPNGLKRNQLSWMDNATVRGGGITQRPAWQNLGVLPNGAIGLYQGAFMYEPDSETPYIIAAIGGNIWQIDPDNPLSAINLSSTFGVILPPTIERYYFVQAEQFLIIQAGDLRTLPLIWDGSTLRKSLGLSGMGYEIPEDNIGFRVFTPSAFPVVVPAFPGGTVVIPTTDPTTLGQTLFVLVGPTFDPVTNEITSFAGIASTWIVTAQTPGVNVTVQILGYSVYSAPGVGLINVSWFRLTNPPPLLFPGTAEIPPATAMDYYMGRLWYAQGRQYAAGDIVGNQASGTLPYNFRDSVLKVTENPLCVGGDGFTVPTNAGNIRAIKHSANINTTLGEGQLFIFTRRAIYSLTVPVTRTDWIGADTNNQPRQTVVQITNGSVNDRSIAEQNGDLFYQSFEPAIRSLVLAVRYYEQWGNVPISINEDRILKFNDRGLMQFASGVSFDNRMLQLVLPEQTPVGVAHRAVVPLNFDVVSTLETKLPPAWEGMYEGVDFLELLTGDFGGRQRCIAPTWSERDGKIHLWEITTADRFENGDNRVFWYVEFPAFTWGDEFQMKKLVSAELWIDRIFGEVMYAMDWRPDGDPCWYKWHEWKLCTARDTCEDVHNPQCLYPTAYCESFRQTITLPRPPNYCQRVSGRPADVGFQFQCRLSIKGFCRIRGLLLKAEMVKQQLYGSDMVCSFASFGPTTGLVPTPPAPPTPPTPPTPTTPPSKATSPSPANGAGGADPDSTVFSWSDGGGATSYDVYLNGVFQGNQTGTSFNPGTLISFDSYTWRIDSVNSGGTTTGDTWTFDTSGHATVVSWAARVVVNGGAAPSAATKRALHVFCLGLDSNALTAKMGAVNCFVPDNVIAAITPLIRLSGNDPWTNNGPFVGADLTVNGLIANGAKWLDTGYVPNAALLTTTSAGLVVYTSADSAVGTQVEIGCYGGAASSLFALLAHNGDANSYAYEWIFSEPQSSLSALSPGLGYYSGQRTAGNAFALYHATGASPHAALASSAVAQTGTIEPLIPLYVFASNNNGGGSVNHSLKRVSFAAVTSGLTSTESGNLFTLVQAMRTTLGGGFV